MTRCARWRGWHAATAAMTLAAVAGCSGSREPARAPKDDARASSPETTSEEVDRLRSLPYAGFSKTVEGAAGEAVTVFDPARSAPGYNLYSIHELCTAELIDAKGRVVRSWHYGPSASWSNVELLPNGDLLVVGWDANEDAAPGIGDAKRYVLRFDFDGHLLWKATLPAHHDIEELPGGDLLTLTFARRVIPAIDRTIPVRDDRVTVLDRSGKERRSLSLYDLAVASPDVFPLQTVAPNNAGGAPWIDLLHGNAVASMQDPALAKRAPLYKAGNVLVCLRHQDRVAVIDPAARRFVWAWGQGVISGPHDAQWLANGHVLLFDNGIARGWSRVVELDPLAGRITWEYRAPHPADFFSVSRGACQRLPNGNTLVTDSDHGTAFEVTPAGETVWRFATPHRNDKGQRATIVRLKRYATADIDALLATHGGAR